MAAVRSEFSAEINQAFTTLFGINANLLALFVAIIAVVAAIVGVVTWYIKSVAAQAAVKRAERSVSQNMNLTAEFYENLSVIRTYGRLSFTYWDFFKEDFRKLVKGRPKYSKVRLGTFAHYAGLSRKLAEDAIYRIGLLTSEKYETIRKNTGVDLSALKAQLQNNFIYLSMVYFTCEHERGAPATEEDKYNLLHEAENLVSSMGSANHTGWFEIYDTAARAFLKFGAQHHKSRAEDLIQSICDGKKPSTLHSSPSDERVDKFRKDFGLL